VKFDASGDRTINNLTLQATDLDKVAGTSGTWPATGIKLDFGDSDDPTRLQLASGPATVAPPETRKGQTHASLDVRRRDGFAVTPGIHGRRW
jgi:hypothetical protein